jgi:hypothetical protein
VRSRTLHAALFAFVEEAGCSLAAERAEGAELPYDVVQAGRSSRGGPALYCYRPMTGEFILAHLDRLRALDTYAPAVRALAAVDGLGHYLRAHGRRGVPVDRRSCAELALFVFLSEVFEEATEFELPADRLKRTYAKLESAVFADTSQTTFLALARGVEIASPEVPLGGGLALVRPEALDDGPADPVLPGAPDEEPGALVTLCIQATPGESGVLEEARNVLSGVVEALTLFGEACVTVDPAGWMRVDDGPWQVVVLGGQASARGVLRIAPLQEDELRAFCSLVSRRAPRGGELAWALARFRMGCEREHRWEGLSDHLLALRALLEPEGPESARLPGRLAALCATPEERAGLAERVADVVALERAVMEGLEPADREAELLADELVGHLRALLRDVICGHLEADVQGLADRLIADAVAEAMVDELESHEQPLDDAWSQEEAGEWVPEEEQADEWAAEEEEEAGEWVAERDETVEATGDWEPGEDETLDERGSADDETVDEPAPADDETVDEPGSAEDPDDAEAAAEAADEPASAQKPAPKPRRTRSTRRPAQPKRTPSRTR